MQGPWRRGAVAGVAEECMRIAGEGQGCLDDHALSLTGKTAMVRDCRSILCTHTGIEMSNPVQASDWAGLACVHVLVGTCKPLIVYCIEGIQGLRNLPPPLASKVSLTALQH